jgi:hypothetical protein
VKAGEATGEKPHLFEVLGRGGVDRGGLPTVAQSRRRVRLVAAAVR